jgi:3-methyladenine DNA glycosylase AlkC
MAAPLKTYFSPERIRELAATLASVTPAFREEAFVAEAREGIEEIELLDRARHLARVMRRHLPAGYLEALRILLASLGPEHASDELEGLGMGPMFYLPHVMFVAEYGLDDFEASMHAQYELTRRFTAEFSIRTYLDRYPERTMAILHDWCEDPNPHVRRLASEGTRFRLPWARRLSWLDANPERELALLERLKDDPSTLVRRSVANNLNDLGKLQPDLLLQTCSRWLEHATPERRQLVEHALRSAIKRGHPGALGILGYGKKPAVSLEGVRFAPATVRIGERLRIGFTLVNDTMTPQEVLVDLAVHFIKANGQGAPKVFKVKRASLPPGGRAEFKTSVSLAIHSTRVPRPGVHLVDVLVNGAPIRIGSFDVIDEAGF